MYLKLESKKIKMLTEKLDILNEIYEDLCTEVYTNSTISYLSLELLNC